MDKKITTFAVVALTVLLFSSTLASSQSPQRFSDVPEGHWGEEAIYWAVDAGITAGTGPTTFAPDDTLTRAQMVTFLHRYHNRLHSAAPIPPLQPDPVVPNPPEGWSTDAAGTITYTGQGTGTLPDIKFPEGRYEVLARMTSCENPACRASLSVRYTLNGLQYQGRKWLFGEGLVASDYVYYSSTGGGWRGTTMTVREREGSIHGNLRFIIGNGYRSTYFGCNRGHCVDPYDEWVLMFRPVVDS